jgi:hypothetical protein
MGRVSWLVLLSSVANARPRDIDPEAAAQVRRMSDFLAGLDSLSVDSDSDDETITAEGERIDVTARSRIALRRPDRLRIDRADRFADVALRYDGRSFTAYSRTDGYYSVATAPRGIDEAISWARDHYGVAAPEADFLLRDPYGALMADASSGRIVGLEIIDGVPCQHLAFRGKRSDRQLWIQTGPEPLPRRYAIVWNEKVGKPKLTVRFTRWRKNPALADEEFAFRPPPGAQPIEFLPIKRQPGMTQ